ncbi:MAG: hypothetical protein JOZ87_35710 [Chloroflexi bacterium]|nr:hypothetical protein [Acidobacteriota bacterium]MBV9602176.1 hypothetical protein [Chloroflexota bacterium]
MRWISTTRIGQVSGSYSSPYGGPETQSEPQGRPLLNETGIWGAFGFDECANTEHNGRLYFFSGDVKCKSFLTNPLNNSDLVAWTDDIQVLQHGGHRAEGFDFSLPHDIAEDANHQARWRYCVRCAGLFFDGYDDKGFQNLCPQGGSHAPNGYNFVLPHDTAEDDQHQGLWRYCTQCGGLFFDGYQDKTFQNICPKGGNHVPAGSNFVLPYAIPSNNVPEDEPTDIPEDANNQPHWRYCVICGALFFNGYSNKGQCPGAPGGGFRLSAVLKDGTFWPFEADPPLGILLSDEMATSAFSYGRRVYVFCGIAQAYWSGQTRPGDPAYGLYLVSSGQPDQPVPYRKEFLFDPRIGVCPADGGSHDVLGYSFVLQHNLDPDPSRQSNWLRCRKCAALFQEQAERNPLGIVVRTLQGGICPNGGSHEGGPVYYDLQHDINEDGLNQANWRRCQKCEGLYWNGSYPTQGICAADRGKHHPASDQIDYVLPHDQPEDDKHQANWRRCRKCYALFWSGLAAKGACPVGPFVKGHADHDARTDEVVPTFLQDELILTFNVADSTTQGQWRFCTKCYGLFFDGDPNFKGICEVDKQPHTATQNDKQPLPSLDMPVIHPPVGYNFMLPRDRAADRWHQAGWRFCAKCAVLFRGQLVHNPEGVSIFDNGHCPAGGSHAPAGDHFVLPHRIWQDFQNDRDWRFCTKCFGLVQNNLAAKFWTVASVVVRNSDHRGIPSTTGDGVLILGYGWSDFYLAWMPLGAFVMRVNDTQYYAGINPLTKAPIWVPKVEEARGLFGIHNLAVDANHISLAWLEGPKRWILLYTHPDQDGQKGYIVARLGSSPWSWSDEIPIVSPQRPPRDANDPDGFVYGTNFIGDHDWPYGPYILNRFTEWDSATRELGIYFLVSFATPYQINLFHTRLSLTTQDLPANEGASRKAMTGK